jgi:dienelactone hydrolase
MKKVLVFILAAMLLLFAACNNDGGGPSPSPSPSSHTDNGQDDPWADDAFSPLPAPETEPMAVTAIRAQTELQSCPAYVNGKDNVITAADPDYANYIDTIPYANAPVHGIFFDSIPFGGKTPKVYAVYGIPAGASAQNPVPGVVLIHGGGNTQTADPNWVREWVLRGYAAIMVAMESYVYYHQNGGKIKQLPESVYPGPFFYGYETAKEKDPGDVTTHWMYHAVAKNILAKRILESFEGVDGGKIGLIGGSWGGLIASTVAGLSTEFQYVVSVYGNGYQSEDSNSAYYSQLYADGGIGARTWDPSLFHYNIKTPVMYYNSDIDHNYPISATSRCALEVKDALLMIKPGLPHRQQAFDPAGALNGEFKIYVEHFSKGEVPLPKVTRQPKASDGKSGVKVKLNMPSDYFYNGADIHYIENSYEYYPVGSGDRKLAENGGPLVNKFKTVSNAVTFDRQEGRGTAEIPQTAVAYYIVFKFSMITDKGIENFTASSAFVRF